LLKLQAIVRASKSLWKVVVFISDSGDSSPQGKQQAREDRGEVGDSKDKWETTNTSRSLRGWTQTHESSCCLWLWWSCWNHCLTPTRWIRASMTAYLSYKMAAIPLHPPKLTQESFLWSTLTGNIWEGDYNQLSITVDASSGFCICRFSQLQIENVVKPMIVSCIWTCMDFISCHHSLNNIAYQLFT
jgi:hypothetical protein